MRVQKKSEPLASQVWVMWGEGSKEHTTDIEEARQNWSPRGDL